MISKHDNDKIFFSQEKKHHDADVHKYRIPLNAIFKNPRVNQDVKRSDMHQNIKQGLILDLMTKGGG